MKNIPVYRGTLRSHLLDVPHCISQCSGIRIFGRRIKSLVFSTDVAIIKNVNADAIIAVYPFTPQPVISQAIINLRYLLMSCALSQKLPTDTSMFHRFWTGFFITDEIFGVSSSRDGKLNPFYTYGVASIAVPGWALGTCLGVILGTALPPRITRALSVALYGMFLAVIIPPARKNHIISGLVIVSMLASSLFSYLPLLSGISSGMRVIILTVILSGLAAVLFPIKEDSENAE